MVLMMYYTTIASKSYAWFAMGESIIKGNMKPIVNWSEGVTKSGFLI